MIKISLSLAVFIACIASYMLYRKEQQHKQHVAAVVSEAQYSLQHVQQNPHYRRQPIDTGAVLIEGE